MLILRSVVSMLAVGLVVLGMGAVCGENYPNKPVRIVTADVGGGSDFVTRIVTQGLIGSWGQQVVVENRGGVASIPALIVIQAPPDGYTLLLYGTPLWLTPLLRDKVPYDPIKDLSPITMAVRSPNILVVNPSVAANSVKELIALAKSKPGELNYASAGAGSTPHLAAEYFKAMTGVNIVHIPYKGGAAAINDVIAGRVQLTFVNVAAVGPNVKSGKLRALAVTTTEPSALLPNLPTIASAGLPGYEAAQMNSVFAPAKTPRTIVQRLNQDFVRVLNQPEVKEKLFNAGVEVVASSPEQLSAAVKSDMAKMGKVIKDVGIRMSD